LILIHPPLSINNWYQSGLPSVQFNHWKEDPKKKWKTNSKWDSTPFDGINFEYWSNRMETYLKSLGEDVWFSVASGYNALKKPKTTSQKEAKRNNKLAIDTILDGLIDSVKSKVGSCASSKYLWDKLQDLYVREDVEEEEEEEVEENYNISNFKEENRGQFFCFNCEGVGHVEFECPHPRIERNDTEEENSNEEEENHEEKIM
jgi:hypothetical protein